MRPGPVEAPRIAVGMLSVGFASIRVIRVLRVSKLTTRHGLDLLRRDQVFLTRIARMGAKATAQPAGNRDRRVNRSLLGAV